MLCIKGDQAVTSFSLFFFFLLSCSTSTTTSDSNSIVDMGVECFLSFLEAGIVVEVREDLGTEDVELGLGGAGEVLGAR